MPLALLLTALTTAQAGEVRLAPGGQVRGFLVEQNIGLPADLGFRVDQELSEPDMFAATVYARSDDGDGKATVYVVGDPSILLAAEGELESFGADFSDVRIHTDASVLVVVQPLAPSETPKEPVQLKPIYQTNDITVLDLLLPRGQRVTLLATDREPVVELSYSFTDRYLPLL